MSGLWGQEPCACPHCSLHLQLAPVLLFCFILFIYLLVGWLVLQHRFSLFNLGCPGWPQTNGHKDMPVSASLSPGIAGMCHLAWLLFFSFLFNIL